MAEPLKFLTERAAAKAAIGMIERGERAEALKLLHEVMNRRKLPERGPDRRAESINRIRGYFERAIKELETGGSEYAHVTLSNALKLQPR